MECFLLHGAVVRESRAIRSASRYGRIDIIELLLKHGGDINEASKEEDIDGLAGTALHVAIAAGRKEVIQWLLAHGADINNKNIEGRTASEVLRRRGR